MQEELVRFNKHQLRKANVTLQVRIGIKAPRDVDVHRDEVWAELQQANRAAALPDRSAVESLERLRRQKPDA